MPRRRNPNETVRLTVRINTQVNLQLKRVVDIGLYGNNNAEVAERLISEGLKRLSDDGYVPKPTAPSD